MVDNVDDASFNPFVSYDSIDRAQNDFDDPDGVQQQPGPASDFNDSTLRTGDLPSPLKLHSRAQTEVNTSSTGHNHPLRSAGLGSAFKDVGITRPHLSRALDASILADVEDAEGEDGDGMVPEGFNPEGEKVVIVHEVSRTDSLAGVALKYGIALSELRRANQLWTSDSIHLRKILYIPLDKTSRQQELLAANHSLPSVSRTTAVPTDTVASNDPNASTIRRVPATQLSFFPPSSTSAVTSPASDLLIDPSPSPPKPHARYTTNPGNSSLNTILQALPINPSTRDTIIARLSFDSASSSYSDRERSWQLNGSGNDIDEGHELDRVFRPGHKPRSMSEDGLSINHEIDGSDRPSGSAAWYNKSPKQTAVNRPSGYGWEQVIRRLESGIKPITHQPAAVDETRRYTGSEDPDSTPLAVRTVQLEPSPVMQVPRRNIGTSRTVSSGNDFDRPDIGTENGHTGKGKGKVRPKLSDVGFDSEGQGGRG
ncbi:hypothetical protein D9758_006386 [Tetrapyrgos nigripes]|uniref:LysM domain-containing protein n=1 Tax=Tetrapyrgos nigripes TaxID=182062 RepID=A0A8H5FZI3_9AGAR|nr:hypothetical protein D9758_006386 [Tetrapyrgos nigripes]